MKPTNRPCYKLTPSKSPASLQLARYLQKAGWKATRWTWRAHFSEKNLQFSEAISQTLEYKHFLAKFSQQYFPDAMPATYPVDDNNWPEVLNQIARDFNYKNGPPDSTEKNLLWILKPALLNNGQYIRIFERLDAIESYYLNPNRLGGPHVLQQYIDEPHLLKGPKLGHKYSIRMFVVLTETCDAFLYPDGYFNIALQPYPGHRFDDLAPHLTNEHLSHDKLNVIQIPSYRYDLFSPFFPQIKAITHSVTAALRQKFQDLLASNHPDHFALLGFDFMVDKNEKVWLLEINHAPCFPVNDDHPLQKSLYDPFWTALVNEIIQPLLIEKTVKTKAFIHLI